MSQLTQSQREDLRHAVREQLAAASTVALTAAMIHRRVERARMIDFPFTEQDVTEALVLLIGLSQAKETTDPLGSTKYYQVTAAGVLAQERGQ